MNLERQSLREQFDRCRDQPVAAWQSLAEEIATADEVDVIEFVGSVCSDLADGSLPAQSRWWGNFFSLLHVWFISRQTTQGQLRLNSELRAVLSQLYVALGANCPGRYQALVMLALAGNVEDLEVLADLIRSDAPQNGETAAAPFVPLLRPDSRAACMFPAIAQCLDSPHLATPVLDLANYLARAKLVAKHPLAERVSQLERMLAALTAQFELLQETPVPDADRRWAIQMGIGMMVALTHALALIHDDGSIVPLTHALSLKHRRVQVEVAAALASFGDAAGIKTLLACAADPFTRLRAIHYASELNLDDEVDDAYQSDAAIAEAEFVSHLAQPTVMGVPPTSCQLKDHRTMYWPGYDEPRGCFLFEFSYRAVDGDRLVTYSNVGVAGPVAHLITENLTQVTLEDVYAAYAGWHADHPEIKQNRINAESPQNERLEAVLDRAAQEGYANFRLTICGQFFGDSVLVAKAERNDQQGWLVVDDFEMLWFPIDRMSPPISDEVAYDIYKGRRLLSQFNSAEVYSR